MTDWVPNYFMVRTGYITMQRSSAIQALMAFFVAVFGLSCSPSTSDNSNPSQLPNIIYILADDLGYGDLSYGNPAALVQTPSIDRVSSEGMRFTDAHSPSAVCSPTRYGILTGRYAWRSRLKSGVLVGVDSVLIESGRKTVGDLLQENGYHTAAIGKWHLGLNWVKRDPDKPLFDGADSWAVTRTNIDYSQPVRSGPRDFGFDYSFVIPSSLDIMPYVYLENNRVFTDEMTYTEGKSQAVDGRGIFWRPGEMSQGFQHEEVLSTFTEQAVQYVESRADTGQPFFLYLPFSAPHTPWLPTGQFVDASPAGTYGDFVQQVDAAVGQIVSTLDRLGLRENTLLFVTSDNGADWTEADKYQYPHLANGRWKGRKADIWEAGHRIPFVVRWPGRVAPGSESDELISQTDLMATLASLVGVSLDKDTGEDSVDILPELLGEARGTLARKAIVHHSLDGMFAVRKGPWKLILGRGSGGFTAPSRYTPGPGEPAGQLYDLENDPAETTNLYLDRPDLVSELTELLEEYESTGRSAPLSE